MKTKLFSFTNKPGIMLNNNNSNNNFNNKRNIRGNFRHHNNQYYYINIKGKEQPLHIDHLEANLHVSYDYAKRTNKIETKLQKEILPLLNSIPDLLIGGRIHIRSDDELIVRELGIKYPPEFKFFIEYPPENVRLTNNNGKKNPNYKLRAVMYNKINNGVNISDDELVVNMNVSLTEKESSGFKFTLNKPLTNVEREKLHKKLLKKIKT